MFGAVSAFKAMKAERPDAKPDDPLFVENHREGIKELLTKADLRVDTEGRTRDAKSLRQTGISLRLDLGPNPDYRDIAKWARTSPAMIAAFYDQTHPQSSVERIVGFRKQPTGNGKAAMRRQSSRNEGRDACVTLGHASGSVPGWHHPEKKKAAGQPAASDEQIT